MVRNLPASFQLYTAVENKIDELGVGFNHHEVAKTRFWQKFIAFAPPYSEPITFEDPTSTIDADSARITHFYDSTWFAKSEPTSHVFSDEDRAKLMYGIGLLLTRDGVPVSREQDVELPEFRAGDYVVYATQDGPPQILAESDRLIDVGDLGWLLKSGEGEILSDRRASGLILALSQITLDTIDLEAFHHKPE